MPTKESRVLNAIKSRAGDKLSAREIGKIADLTALECGMILSRLSDEGSVERIYTKNRDVASLWRYINEDRRAD